MVEILSARSDIINMLRGTVERRSREDEVLMEKLKESIQIRKRAVKERAEGKC
jgi:hypothetical protein